MDTIPGLTLRTDGRWEVADEAEPDRIYGCTVDAWCVLCDGHSGPCDHYRER